MKKLAASLIGCLSFFYGITQNNIGIGTLSPDASARLDVTATDKGILVPRISITNISSASPVISPAAGLLIWNTNASVTGGSGIGFYYWDGLQWQSLLSDVKGWKLSGNSGTNPALQFLGTTDNQPVNFRANNLQAGKIDNTLHNAFFGIKAGLNTSPSSSFDARYNTFIGDSAGLSNTTGSSNTFVGREAGSGNTTAVANSFFGYQAGQSNTTGQPNSFFGYQTGQLNTTGGTNSYFGYFAGQFSSTGSENCAFGASAGRGSFSGLTGNLNSSFGRMAGFSLSSGSDNSYFGAHAGYNTTTGINNTFIGDSSGYNNTTGGYNTFVGKEAGLANSTAIANSFFGYEAGLSNTTGQPNSFFGYQSGMDNTTGGTNSFYGYFAGQFNTTGSENCAFGASAGRGDFSLGLTGNLNSSFGRMAGFSISSGSDNSNFGDHAGYNIAAGSLNTSIGDSAGFVNTTGNQNTFLGYQANPSGNSFSNATAIGARAQVGASNSMVLGSINGINGAIADTKVGIGTFTPAYKLHVVNDKSNDGGYANGIVVENTNVNTGEAAISFKNTGASGTGDKLWIVGLNQGRDLDFSYGTSFAGSLTKMVIDSTGQVGIGTTTPSEPLEVVGNIKVSGDVLRPSTGGANMVPICYGNVTSSGTIDSGTPNFSVVHTSTGIFTISITSESYSFISYSSVVTAIGISAVIPATFSSGGSLVVRLFNASGTAVDSDFNFVVYKN